MATTRSNATGASPVKLRFNEKITGRGLSSDALQRKLKALLDELASITETEPENIDLATFATVRKDLIAPSMILHKDKGVRAYVACCIAELLNVYAPDAPYTAAELKDIFQFFFRQLMGGLKGADAPYYQLFHDLLASLSRTKSAVLVCDLPHADDLLVEIFKDFFTLASLALPTPIEAYMADIMSALLDECQVVPSEVVEILIAQFNAKKSSSTTPCFRVAIEVCNASSDKLIRPVCQYFTDTIVQHPFAEPDENNEDGDGRDLESIRAAHNLVKRMHRHCPKLLLSVIPQLQEEMAVDDVQIRLLATETLGEMYAQIEHGSELMKQYRSTWVQWIARKNDKTPAIRIAFVEASKKLISNVDMRADISEAMKAKILDPDEKVRQAVCKIYGELDYETAAYHVSEDMLTAVGGRCLDTKHIVRIEAFDTMGKLYSQAANEIERGDATAIAQFGWIPGTLFHASKMGAEVRVVAEDIIARYILPLPTLAVKDKDIDEEEWTERLLRTFATVDQSTFDSFLAMTGLQSVRPSAFANFVECCLAYNGGTIDKDEAAVKNRFQFVVRQLSSRFPNPPKVQDDLNTFAKHHDRRLYKYLTTCIDVQTDLKGLVKAKHEFLKIIEKDLPVVLTTMQIFLRRCSLWLVNKSSIPTLLKILGASSAPPSSPTKSSKGSPSKGSSSKAKANGHATGNLTGLTDPRTIDYAQQILKYISKHCAALYYSHLPQLAKELHTKGASTSFEISLRVLAAVAALGTDQTPVDSKLPGVMSKLVLGQDREHAKFATRYLANAKDKEKYASTLIEKLSNMLPKADDEYLVAHITALSEFAIYCPDQFEEKSETIVKFLVQDLIYRPVNKDRMETDEDDDKDQDEDEWCKREELEPIILAKCQTLRLLTNRCIAHSKGDDNKVSRPVTKLLLDTLEQDGSFSPFQGDEEQRDRLRDTREGGASARSWIRLKAAKSLLRLGQIESFMTQIMLRFPTIAVEAQDFCFEVRKGFIGKLLFLLTSNKLPPIFYTIPFLTCHDVEPSIKDQVRKVVMQQIKRMLPQQRLRHFELIFVRYLWLLAHHPDYDESENEEGLPALAKYIDFYLDLVATGENVSLLYHLALQCKTVHDAENDPYSERLYLLSEIADYAIKQRAQHQGWLIPPYPDKVTMPKDIMRPLSSEALKRVRSKVYLTEEMIELLGEVGKPHKQSQPKPRKKRARNQSSKPRRVTKRRKKDDSDNEEIESDVDEDASSVAEPPAPTSDEEMSDGDGSETEGSTKEALGRGARGRAKAKAKKKAKKGRKQND